MITKLVTGVIVAITATFPSHAATASRQFSSPATMATLIKNFEHVLTTKGSVDYSHVKDISTQISNSAADQPTNRPLSGHACFQAETAAPIANPCVFANARAKDTMVLFGDSHIGEYLNTFVGIATLRHVRLITFTRAACGALQEKSAPGPAYAPNQSNCETWRRRVLSALHAMRPNEIVFGQDVDGLPWRVGPIGSYASTLSRALSSDVADGRASSVVALVDHESATYSGWGANSNSTAYCLTRNNLRATYSPGAATSTWRNDQRDCYRVYTHNVFDVPLSSRDQLTRAFTAAGVSVVDPRPWMCDKTPTTGLCPPIIGGTLIYRDITHLTATFTGRLVTVMNAALPVR